MPAKWENSAVATGLEKVSFHSSPNERQRKNAQTTAQLHLSHTVSKVMLRIPQARLQQYMNQELPDVQAEFRKGRGTRDQIASIHWTTEKQENSRKTPTSASLATLTPSSVWITSICGKFLKR